MLLLLLLLLVLLLLLLLVVCVWCVGGVVLLLLLLLLNLLFLNKNYCWTPLLSDPTFSPEITLFFFSKTTHFPQYSDDPPNPALVVAEPLCFHLIFCPLHREYSLLLKISYVGIIIFQKVLGRSHSFYVPTINYCRFFIKIS